MRLGKKLITFAVAGLALVGTAACSNGNQMMLRFHLKSLKRIL